MKLKSDHAATRPRCGHGRVKVDEELSARSSQLLISVELKTRACGQVRTVSKCKVNPMGQFSLQFWIIGCGACRSRLAHCDQQRQVYLALCFEQVKHDLAEGGARVPLRHDEPPLNARKERIEQPRALLRSKDLRKNRREVLDLQHLGTDIGERRLGQRRTRAKLD